MIFAHLSEKNAVTLMKAKRLVASAWNANGVEELCPDLKVPACPNPFLLIMNFALPLARNVVILKKAKRNVVKEWNANGATVHYSAQKANAS